MDEQSNATRESEYSREVTPFRNSRGDPETARALSVCFWLTRLVVVCNREPAPRSVSAGNVGGVGFGNAASCFIFLLVSGVTAGSCKRGICRYALQRVGDIPVIIVLVVDANEIRCIVGITGTLVARICGYGQSGRVLWTPCVGSLFRPIDQHDGSASTYFSPRRSEASEAPTIGIHHH